MLQRGCQLLIVYSRFFGRGVGEVTEEQLKEQGIRVAVVDLSHLAVQHSFFADHTRDGDDTPEGPAAAGGHEAERVAFRAKLRLMATQQSGGEGESVRDNWWGRRRSQLGALWRRRR